jgi:carotenoid cleavage dioxygenase
MSLAAPRPYLEGNYAPVHTELSSAALRVVSGEIPRDLFGTYARIGSNPQFAPRSRHHWFDGDGMVHAVSFGDGKARYDNRWVRSDAFLAEQKEGRALWNSVMERPDFENPRGPFKDAANTDLVYFGGKLLATWWLGGEPYRLALPSLETCGKETFGGKVKTMSAHPKLDPVTGELLFFDYKPYPPYLSYFVANAKGEVTHATTLSFDGPRLQHDMAITERFTIFFDMSMMLDPKLLAQGRSKIAFLRDRPSRIGVLPRYAPGSEVRWFEVSPFYMYHQINAWEDGERVVILGCKIEDPLAGDEHNPKTDAPTIGFLRLDPALVRWTLDLATGTAKEEQLDDTAAEFPRMDNRALGRRSRFAYAPKLAKAPTLLFEGVLKYDTDTGSAVEHRYADGWFGGETPFAPREGSEGEDDGYLVTFVVNEASGESEVHVLDARDVARPPVCRIAIPQRVPTGYHAWWVPGAELVRHGAGEA